MLISTMNDVPGSTVASVLGEVFGLTVRSRNVGSQFGAAFTSLAGGEICADGTAVVTEPIG